MFSNYELRNFRRYIETTPKHLLGKAPVLSAYDAASGARAHGFGQLQIRNFSPGGALDSTGGGISAGGGAEKTMRFLASRLSESDWAELREALCAGGDPDDAMDRAELSIPRRDKDGFPRSQVAELAEDSRRRYAEMFPNAARLGGGHSAARPRARAKPPTAEARQSFEERFPNASRIGRAY